MADDAPRTSRWRGGRHTLEIVMLLCVAVCELLQLSPLVSLSPLSLRLPILPVSAQQFGLCPSACNCSLSAPPTGNRTVNVAMMFWGPPANDTRFTEADGSVRVRWPRNPLLDGWSGPAGSELDRMFLRAYLLWEERMQLPAAHGGGPGLILLDGSVMRFNLSWFHAGTQADYTQLGSDEYPAAAQSSWAHTLVERFADPSGPYGRQHFVLSPLQGNDVVALLASLACEASGSCLVVSPSAIEARLFICKEPMPVDCINRQRRVGSRRFEATVSAASNGDYWASGSLTLLVNRGVKRVYVIAELWSAATIAQLRSTAKELGIAVLGVQMIEPFAASWSAYNTSAPAVSAVIQSLAPDMLIVISADANPALLQLLLHFRSIDYLPSAVAWLAGGAASLPPELSQFFLVENTWLPQLTGEKYRALLTDSNFEAFPANATHDSPAVFADAYESRFDDQVPDSLFFQAARAVHATTIVQKLLEHAQSEDTLSLQQSAARIAVPGVFHEVQFEQWGRSLPFDNFVLQLMPDGRERILTPLGLGNEPIVPIPLWSERVSNRRFLSKLSDRISVAVTVVAIAYLLAWLIWLVSCWQHPVLRVSDPLFSALSIAGLMVLQSSNFFGTSYQNDVSCTATKWLFTCGLTLGFAPLILKNLRIWSLWQNAASLNPAPIRQWHMFVALVGLLLLDTLINVWWYLATGMQAYEVIVDPYRPSLDYHACASFANGKVFFLAQVLYKLAGVAAALYLAYLLRRVSSTYSESRFIALSVYNVALALAVTLPVISSEQTLGTERTLLIRNMIMLFLCVSTASIMCIPKWIAVRDSNAKRRAQVAAAHQAGDSMASSEQTSTPQPAGTNSGPPSKSSLKIPPRDARENGIGGGAHGGDAGAVELQSVHDAHFQSGMGLSAVARSVDNEASNTNTQAPPSSLYAPYPPVGRLHGASARINQSQSNHTLPQSSAPLAHVPVLPPIVQSPVSSHVSQSSNPASLLRATCDLLEGPSELDLTAGDLARIQSALGQCLTRRSLRRQMDSSDSSSSFGPCGTESACGSAGSSSLLSDTPHVAPLSGRVGAGMRSALPAAPSFASQSACASVDDSPRSPHPLLPPASSHVLSIRSNAESADVAAASSSGHARERTPPAPPFARRSPLLDCFDTGDIEVVSFHTD